MRSPQRRYREAIVRVKSPSGSNRRLGRFLPTAVMLLVGHLLVLSSAAAQAPLVHDSLSVDSIRFDEAPLPGGAADVFRFLFSGVPQWIQISGFIVGIIAALLAFWFTWRKRREAWSWLVSRSAGFQIALVAGLVAVVTASAAAGAWSWDYMMHDNDFCSSCHVMKGAFSRFGVSEHQKLECHSCHRQSIFASSKELYYWVLDRPEKIPPHAPVPDKICGECHAQQPADSAWKRISATAGHRVHFESDSSALKDLSCLSCHAKEIHAFKAVDLSCTTSGCHSETKVQLGGMANQTGLHCITCHDFGRPVSELVAIDSSRTALVPARQECLSCHTMASMLSELDLDKDPHKATCGTCHNPHTQEVSAGAYGSCTTAGCHSSPDTLTAFHRGLQNHKLDQCGACHKPHSWKTESTNCIDCHANIFRRGPIPIRRVPGAPTAQSREPPDARRIGGPSDEDPWYSDRLADLLQPRRLRGDTLFDHNRHKAVQCTACHSTTRSHGAVSVTSASDCQSCHHAADKRAGACAACHTSGELAGTMTVPVQFQITGSERITQRELPFDHPRHAGLACAGCHTEGIDQRVTATCASCHTNHHRADATCSSCHGDAKAVHDMNAHVPCASCHRKEGTADFPPSRAVCLACHAAQASHKPQGNCATCHLTSWASEKAS